MLTNEKEPICDFCSAKTAPWVFKADTYVAWENKYLNGLSVGDWAACDTCKQLVDAGDRVALTARSFECMVFLHPEMHLLEDWMKEGIKEALKDCHEGFFANRRVE